MFKMMLTDMFTKIGKRAAYVIGLCLLWNIWFGGVFGIYWGKEVPDSAVRGSISILLLLLIYQLMQQVPLRVCRGLFVCAAGDRERKRYLIAQLSVKMLFSLLLSAAVLLVMTKGIFVSSRPLVCVVQGLLYFFTVLNINMKVGIGIRGARKVDERGYAIYSRTEMAVNTYWYCLILIQNVFFYTCLFLRWEPADVWVLVFAAVMILLNGFFVIRYFGPVLQEAMVYENVYRQEPEKEYVQYDIV